MQNLFDAGFTEKCISQCAVVQRGEDGSVVSIKWSSAAMRRAALKTMLQDHTPPQTALVAVADRVLSQHATVCAVDRCWSELRKMFPSNRSRLAVEKANKMMLVRNSYRLKHRIEAADDEVEKAFWIEDLAA